MLRHTAFWMLGVLMWVPASQAAQVWSSTFDTNADGVVDARNNNPNKVMIGANTGGRQSITTMGYPDTLSDKAGRPLGGNVGANSSFGAYYKWQYTGYETDGSNGVEELAGFVADTSPHSTRQMMGAAFIHYMSGGNHFIRFGARWASEGNVGSGRKFRGPDVNLGAALPVGQEFQIAQGYDGVTKVLTVALFDAAGNQLKMVSGDIRTFDNLGVPPNDPALQLELNQLSLGYLGWSDFISGSSNKTHTWGVDTLNYYNDPEGSFLAVVPEPGSLVLLAGGLLLVRRARRR